ncbi:MAG TPA: hypothetical protein VM029_08675, partial [Opitutaceae bacterium]|nr:hypothetical protein [Opitutaceae bacterium]
MNTPRSPRIFAAGLAALALALGTVLPAQEARLANLSTRAQAGTGANVLTAGFVIPAGASKQVVIRAVGPTLGTAFGLTGVLADPQITLVGANSAIVATNNNWNASDAAAFTSVGAFALPSGSLDAAIVMTLAP